MSVRAWWEKAPRFWALFFLTTAFLPSARLLHPLLAIFLDTFVLSPFVPIIFGIVYVWKPLDLRLPTIGDHFRGFHFWWLRGSCVLYLGFWLHTLLRQGLLLLWEDFLKPGSLGMVWKAISARLGGVGESIGGSLWEATVSTPATEHRNHLLNSTSLPSSCLSEVIRSFPVFLGFQQLQTGMHFVLEHVSRSGGGSFLQACGLNSTAAAEALGRLPSVSPNVFLQMSGRQLPSVLGESLKEILSSAETQLGSRSYLRWELGLLVLVLLPGIGSILYDMHRRVTRDHGLHQGSRKKERPRKFWWKSVLWNAFRLLCLWSLLVYSQSRDWEHLFTAMGLEEAPRRSLVRWMDFVC